MDLRNALAVCLISLFSATLVVLIARSLDNQAASRIEPQLAQIVEEIRALRGAGGIASSPVTQASAESVPDGLVVYYFHSNARCPTCRSIESQAKETVQTQFATEIDEGKIVWKTANFERDADKPLATKFDVQMPVVVLAKMKDGQVGDWRRLDEVWAMVGDRPAFMKYVQENIQGMLAEDQSSPPTDPAVTPATNPAPAVESEVPLEVPSGALPE